MVSLNATVKGAVPYVWLCHSCSAQQLSLSPLSYGKTLECYQYAQFLEYKDKKIGLAAPIYDKLCDQKQHGASCLSAGMIALNTKGEVGGAGPAYGTVAFQRFDEVCSSLHTAAVACTDRAAPSRRALEANPKDAKMRDC